MSEPVAGRVRGRRVFTGGARGGLLRIKTIGRALEGEALDSSVSRFLLSGGVPLSPVGEDAFAVRVAIVRGPGPGAGGALSSEPLLTSTGLDATFLTNRIGRGCKKY